MANKVDLVRKRRRQYTPVACNECKRRKTKCDGLRTCRRCAKFHVICVYDRLLQGADQSSSWTINGEDFGEPRLPQPQVRYDGDAHALHMISHATEHIPCSPPGVGQVVQATMQSAQNVASQYGATSARNYSVGVPMTELIHLDSPDMFAFPKPHNETFHFNSEAMASRSALSEFGDSKIEVLGLIDSFREEAETLYPFVDMQEMKELVEKLSECPFSAYNPAEDTQTSTWNDLDDKRNMDLLRLILACALAAKEKKETVASQDLMASAEKNNFMATRNSKFDFKNIAIATMLSVYHYQCDEMTLAWRKIGAAARLCLELGMHQVSSFKDNSLTARQEPWASKLFWCIYVLDRRYSFMTNLPFTFRDQDIDLKLPMLDKSMSYLLPMVTYGRLGAKIIPAMPIFGRASTDPDIETCTNLGEEIDTWRESTKRDLMSLHMNGSQDSEAEKQNSHRLQVFLDIRCNQMRLSLYKHALYSPASFGKSQKFARLAVRYAKENIRIFDQLKTTNNYESQAVQYSFFLVSSLAVIFLAVKNASQQFGGEIHEYFLGLGLLKSLCMTSTTSKALCKKTQALENAISGLSVQGIRSFSAFSPESNHLEDDSQRNGSPAIVIDELPEIDTDSVSTIFQVSAASVAQPSLEFGSFMDDNIFDVDGSQGFSAPYDDELWQRTIEPVSQGYATILNTNQILSQPCDRMISAGPTRWFDHL